MPFVLCVALFVPMALAVADAARKKFCEALPMVFLGLCLVLYILGVFSLLPCAVWLLYLFWLGCLLYLGLAVWRMAKQKRWHLPWAGLLAFLAAAAALWWMVRGARYAIWDEFSHWGRAVKAVHGQQVLPGLAAGQDQFRDYPPGTSLLQALVLWAGRMPFREDVVIYVQGLFSVSLLLYPLRGYAGKQGLVRTPGAALLLVLAPACVFWNYYTGTMVDGLLGVLFGFALAVHFVGENGPFEQALKCLALAMLPLVKTSGLLFAVIVVAIMAVDGARTARAAGQPAMRLWPLPGWVAPLVCTLAAAGSWSLFLQLNHVERRWEESRFSFGSLMGLFTGTAPAWQRQTAQSYFASIFTETNYGWPVSFLPYMGFFALFIGAYWLLRRTLGKAEKRRWDTGFWGLWLGGLLYVLSLLITYLYFFSEYEAVRLSSLSRYLNTYLVAMLVFLAALLAQVVRRAKTLRGWACGLAAGGALWAVLGQPVQVLRPLVTAPQYAVSTAANLQAYADAADKIAPYADGDTAKVYVVAQDDLGETTLRLGYELFPVALPDHVSSIGPNYAEDDLLSLRITRDEWAQALAAGYEYVYLFRTDEAFVNEFGPLFAGDITDGAMYRVVPTDGGVTLEPAGP